MHSMAPKNIETCRPVVQTQQVGMLWADFGYLPLCSPPMLMLVFYLGVLSSSSSLPHKPTCCPNQPSFQCTYVTRKTPFTWQTYFDVFFAITASLTGSAASLLTR
eukprot:scaffold192713_cov20-Prasinocladus_malaysianus.AAC.1